MRVRKFPHNKVTSRVASLKMERMIYCESALEEHEVHFLEYDPDVISYQEQPFKIEYFINNQSHHYTPDFFVERIKQNQVVEVKHSTQVNTEENKVKFEAGRVYCEERGYDFRVITELELQNGFMLENIKKMYYRVFREVPNDIRHFIIETIQDKGSITVLELSNMIKDSFKCNEALNHIYTMLYYQDVKFNITEKLSEDTLLSI